MPSIARTEADPARPIPGRGDATPAWLDPGSDVVPDRLPDGSPWPGVAVIVMERGLPGAAETSAASCRRQTYPALDVARSPAGPAGLARLLASPDVAKAAYVLPLSAGDRLAPGAIASLVLAAWMHEADAVAGLRVVQNGRILFHDILAAAARRLTQPEALAARRAGAATGWRGGDLLLRRDVLARLCDGPADLRDGIAAIWPGLASSGATLARIARPVLIQDSEQATPLPSPARLNIAALNDTGGVGGAGIAHRRLIEALRLAGHRVTEHALVGRSPSVAAEWTDAYPAHEAAILDGAPDVVLAGNLHGATRSSELLERLARQVPVLATLHDLFLLTGRCAHPAGCTRIVEGGCDALCPTTTFYPQLAPDRVAGVWAGKRRLLQAASRPVLLANSEWTAQEAIRLGPEGVGVARIDLPFPSQIFRPGDKAALRRRLGLPPGDVLILFAATIADQADKGAGELAAVLSAVAGPGIGFVGIGRIDDPAAFPLPNLVAPGPIGGEATLAAWFAACDILVTASRLETLGQTPIEAGLCGLPTVAYRATGLATAVIDGVSGVLVEPRPEALAAALKSLIADPKRRARLSASARLALEGRNSHASAALGLHAVFAEIGLLPGAAESGRLVFPPELFGSFAMAAQPIAGAVGAVSPPPGRAVRLARRLKHRVFGRAQPLWMRRALYWAHRLGTRARAGARDAR